MATKKERVRLNFIVDKDISDSLTQISDQMGLSKTAVVIMALHDFEHHYSVYRE